MTIISKHWQIKEYTFRYVTKIPPTQHYVMFRQLCAVYQSSSIIHLSNDLFEILSSGLLPMSVIQSLITFVSQSSLSLRSPSVRDLSNRHKSSPRNPQRYRQVFSISIESFISAFAFPKLKESKQCNIPGLISLPYFDDSTFNVVSESTTKLI